MAWYTVRYCSKFLYDTDRDSLSFVYDEVLDQSKVLRVMPALPYLLKTMFCTFQGTLPRHANYVCNG